MHLNIVKNLYGFFFTKENKPKVLVILWLLNSFFLTVSRFLLHRIGVEGFVREAVLFSVTLIPIIFLVKFYIEDKSILKDSRLFFIIYALSILSFLVGYIFHPEYKYFFFREEYGLLRVFRPDSAIYALLFFCFIDKDNDFYAIIKYFSYFKFFELMVFSYLPRLIRGYWVDINYLGDKVTRLYSLSFGYALIALVVIFIYIFYRERKIHDLALSFIGMVIVFFNGSRGALILPMLFVFFISVSNFIHYDTMERRIKKLFILIFIIILCLLSVDMLKKFFIEITQILGLKSRIITKMLTSSIFDLTGRDAIWNSVWNAIKNNWFFGYGAYGDRPFVFPVHFVGYSHNILLEMMCSFGVFGLVICLFLLFNIIKIFLCKDKLWRELFIVFFVISCQLFLSTSFWYLSEFWIMIAILYKYHRISKRKATCQKIEEI